MLPQTETQFPVGGHYFVQPDYQKRIAEIITEDVREDYEIR
jgi:hypothetical protein